jgi:tRNA(Ile)-lysidine synthase
MQKEKQKKIFNNSYNNNLFLYKIKNTIIERNLLQPNQRILIAVSGGQDSICLLRSLYHLKRNWNWKLGIIHCDHRWNDSSNLQATHVAYLAGSLQIDYYQGVTIHFVKKEGIARIWRYKLIQSVAISNNYTAIITGHNANDRIETLLYNLIRGSGLHGLQSIRWKRSISFSHFAQSALCKKNAFAQGPSPEVSKRGAFLYKKITFIKTFNHSFLKKKRPLFLIRPLLEITRTEIRNLLNYWNFPSWYDKTNKELKIKRNRIRHRIIPYIRIHYNPNIIQTLTRWAEIVHNENLYFEQLTHSLVSKIEIKENIVDLYKYDESISLKCFDNYRTKSFHKKEKDINIFYSILHLDLLRSLPLALQRRLLKHYIYTKTGQILGFQYIEQIRLSFLYRTIFSSSVKKPKFLTPWIVCPKQIKILVIKNYLFLFYKKSYNLK